MNVALRTGAGGTAEAAPGPGAEAVPQASEVFGGFDYGGMSLALPISALREVVPWQALCRLPCAAAAVLGGLDVRGTVVPVVDLALALGQPLGPAERSVVIVVAHEGQLFGLLADRITGMFAAPVSEGGQPEPAGALYRTSLQRPDGGGLVSLLSAAALAALPGLPRVPDRGRGGMHAGEAGAAGGPQRPVLLMRCGAFGLALDALAVHATLSDPRLQPSVLARGSCVGVLAYAGRHIAAVELARLCGLASSHDATGTARQAVVIRSPEGDVALLVDEVLDVVLAYEDRRVPVPALALARPALFEGVWPLQALPASTAEGPAAALRQFLGLSADGLRADPEFAALASTNTPLDASASGGGAPPAHAAGAQGATGSQGPAQVVVTFDVLGEQAAPIEQLSEILHFDASVIVHPAASAIFGMVIDRGRSIPVICLRALAGMERGEWQPGSCVLVVRRGEQYLGFAANRLRTIEAAERVFALPARGDAAGERFANALGSDRVATLRDAHGGERTLRLLNLEQLADELLSGRRVAR